eukprot:scpid95012/ scgid4217/ 
MFAGTGIRIVTDAARYLRSFVGEPEAVAGLVRKRLDGWSRELRRLSQFAKTEPHAAYAALAHGLWGRWLYLFRTVPIPDECVKSAFEFLPALTGRGAFTEEDLRMLRLPTRLGGLAIPSFQRMSQTEFGASVKMTEAQVAELVNQNNTSWERCRTECIGRLLLTQKDAPASSELQQVKMTSSWWSRLHRSTGLVDLGTWRPEGCPAGSIHCHCGNMVTTSRKEISVMLWCCGTTGHWRMSR